MSPAVQPTPATIADRVRTILVEHLGVDLEQITERSNLIDDLGADSLDEIEMILAAEEDFGIAFSDDEAGTILTVGDAIRLVTAKVDAAGTPAAVQAATNAAIALSPLLFGGLVFAAFLTGGA